jgi:branched-chain amino acid transport system permease protein
MERKYFFLVVALAAGLGLTLRNEYLLHVLILTFIWCTVVAAWDLVMGYAGILNFAQLVFFAAGGYAAGMISIQAGITPALAIPLAAVIVAGLGIAVGAPCLRLRGEYVVLFTFAVHLATPTLLEQGRSIGTGGSGGLMGMPPLRVLGHVFYSRDKVGWYFATLGLAALSCYFIYYVVLKKKSGRAFIALRDAETSAKALGVNEYGFKLLVFALSAAITGLAGAFYTSYVGLITPSVLGNEFFLIVMAMLSIGGLGRYPGVLVGAVIVTLGNEALRAVGEYRLLIVGIVLVFTILFMPDGLVEGMRRLWAHVQKYRHRMLPAVAIVNSSHGG